MKIEAQRKAAAAITAAAVAHDPIITTATAGSNVLNNAFTGTIVSGIIAGPDSSNYALPGLTAETYNGYSTTPGTLPAGLDNSYRAVMGLGVPQPVVLSEVPANSALIRAYDTNTTATASTGNTAPTSTELASALTSLLSGTSATTSSNTALASDLASLLGLTSTSTSTSATSNTALASDLVSLLSALTGTGTTTESPLAALLVSGLVPTAGQTTTTTALLPSSGTFTQFFSPVSPLTSPVNPSPLPLNGVLPFTRTPINPSPLPPNGVLA